ncbi:MAG: ribokinase [Anaerolineales bacterium]|nr:ribokinase [Anaerolineales bacterium]
MGKEIRDFQFNGEILCMGSINMDLVMRVERFPIPGETVITDNFATYPGGKGGNQAVAASLLGGQVTMLTKLSDDDFSRQLEREMAGRGVTMDRVIIQPGSTAGIAMIWVDKSGENTIACTSGSNALMTPDDVRDNQDLFVAGRILLITNELNVSTVYEAISLASERGMFVIFDPAPAPQGPLPKELPGNIDIIKPNETEAASITGVLIEEKSQAIKALNSLRASGMSLPIITLGKYGIVALIDNEVVDIAPIKVETVDSTAAGDVFSGALAAALSTGSEIGQALHFANAAGALSTTTHGAQSSIPTLSQVMDFLPGCFPDNIQI